MPVKSRTSELRVLTADTPNPLFKRENHAGEPGIRMLPVGTIFSYHVFSWDDGSIEQVAYVLGAGGRARVIERAPFITAMVSRSDPRDPTSYRQFAMVASHGGHSPDDDRRVLERLWTTAQAEVVIARAYRDVLSEPVDDVAEQ